MNDNDQRWRANWESEEFRIAVHVDPVIKWPNERVPFRPRKVLTMPKDAAKQIAGRKFGYARVSTTDQKLRMQRDALGAFGCARIFEDHGVSGARASRPGLDELLGIIRPGDTVVVLKLDRLGRSVLNLADLLVRFHDDGIHFCSLAEGINTATPGGKLVYHLFSAIAEFQRDLIVENTVLGMQAARRRGKHIGRPYALDDETIRRAHRAITIDECCASEIAAQLGVARITLDRSLRRIASKLE